MAANVARWLEESARTWPGKRVLITDARVQDWTEFERRAGGLAQRLAAEGIGPGDRVALDIADPAEVVVALFGALKTGAGVTPLNPRLTEDERAKIRADLDPRFTVTEVGEEQADFPAREVAPESPAIVLYTSGSTGLPKGVLLSHAATVAALESWRGPVMGLGESDVSLSALPLAHSLGIFGSVLGPLLSGASVVFLPRFGPEEALAAIARHRVTVFPGVATMFRRILDSDRLADADLSSLRYVLSGAAPCPWDLFEAFRAATGLRIIRGYGMTELFRPISYLAGEPEDRADSIGRAVPGVELRVIDEAGSALDAGETGELQIRSPARLTGYLNKPEETAAVLAGEWFRTGDLATVSADGYVRIVGRMKDMILRGGYTIVAGEVEAVLTTHPAVADAAVIGVPDDEMGEEIAAFVALKPDATATAEEIIAFCRDRMARFKYPRHVRFAPELPKGPTGKIVKAELRL